MKNYSSVILIGILFLVQKSVFSADADMQKQQVKERLGKVFYWQIADELNLKPEIEKQLVSILENAQEKRQKLLELRDELFDSYHRQYSSLPHDKFVKTYQEFTLGMQKVENDEFMELKKLLSPSQLTQFLLVRDVFSKRVREALKRVETRKQGP